jgi:hypothetical protein
MFCSDRGLWEGSMRVPPPLSCFYLAVLLDGGSALVLQLLPCFSYFFVSSSASVLYISGIRRVLIPPGLIFCAPLSMPARRCRLYATQAIHIVKTQQI